MTKSIWITSSLTFWRLHTKLAYFMRNWCQNKRNLHWIFHWLFIWALSLEYKNVNTFIIYIVWRFKDFSLTFITLNLVCSRYPEILFDQAHNIWLTYVLTLKKNCCVLRFYKSCPWLQLSVLSVLWFGWEPTCTYLYCRYKF